MADSSHQAIDSIGCRVPPTEMRHSAFRHQWVRDTGRCSHRIPFVQTHRTAQRLKASSWWMGCHRPSQKLELIYSEAMKH